MDYDTITNDFISRFPELALKHEETNNLWKDDIIPPHCFFGYVLNGYVTELLRENSNKKQLEKIFRFYEEMARCEDVQVRNLLQVTLLEYLWDKETIYKNAVEYMQSQTKAINNEISSYLEAPFKKQD